MAQIREDPDPALAIIHDERHPVGSVMGCGDGLYRQAANP